MSATVGRFLKHLSDSGVLALDEVKALQGKVPAANLNDDAKEFALELVRQSKLTPFQANAIYNGKLNGLILDDYVILDRIGAGGMGMVFKAEHRRMKRLVAIKVLSNDAMKEPENLRRFHREVQAAAKLTHPNIVAAHDARQWQATGRHYLVMEFVDGIDLAKLVEKQGVLKIDQAVDYITQAARGLEHAHKTGVVHRDIKPANLLLDKSGIVKILDMGLARLQKPRGPFSEPKDDSELMQTGSIMGTVDFMSPEQALDSRHVSPAADIYSLGCTFYFLLVGRPLYEGDTVLSRLVAHRESPPPSLLSARKDVPEEIDAIYRKMVAKNIEDRYQSMSEIVRDLSNWRKAGSKPTAAESALLGDEIPQNVINAIFDEE
jgi:serine/threonine protein kinase